MATFNYDTRQMNTMAAVENLTKGVLKRLLQEWLMHPDDVVIETTPMTRSFIVKVTVNPLDGGRVIGKKGAAFKALAAVVRAMARRYGFDAHLERIPLSQTSIANRVKYPPLKLTQPAVDRVEGLLRDLCQHIFKSDDVGIKAHFSDMEASMEVTVPPDERLVLVEEMREAIPVIFERIAMKHGSKIYITLISKGEAGTRLENDTVGNR